MKKILYLVAFLISVNLLIINVYAFVDTTKEEKSRGEELQVVTFDDYEPFGKKSRNEGFSNLKSIFASELIKFAESKNYSLKAAGFNSDYVTNVRAVRSGKYDVIIGAYSLTKLYNGIEFVYPSMINNPVNVAMMPDKIDQVSVLEDLKSMKGVRLKDEILNDYVEGLLTKFNVEKVDTLNEAYEKLFIGEVDYVIGGYYNLLAEAIKLGIRPYISFSKKSLWDIPVFIGVSKTSKINRKLLIRLLTAWSNTESVKESIKQNLRDYIEGLEREYDGVVPPMYIRQDDGPTAAGNVSVSQDFAPEEILNQAEAVSSDNVVENTEENMVENMEENKEGEE